MVVVMVSRALISLNRHWADLILDTTVRYLEKRQHFWKAWLAIMALWMETNGQRGYSSKS